MSGQIDLTWTRGFALDFDLKTGLSKSYPSSKRKLSQMKGMYADEAACNEMLKKGDPVIYEFYELPAPQTSGDFAFGTSICNPGKVGNEYYMTKGHFHTILETGEVYYTLSGNGFMMMESPEGDVNLVAMSPGQAVYVPPRYAHRTINAGKVQMVSFFVYRADSGHNYGTIETTGYRNHVVEGPDGKPQMVPNPRWQE
jgi:glucose-6-phosphate isomerase